MACLKDERLADRDARPGAFRRLGNAGNTTESPLASSMYGGYPGQGYPVPPGASNYVHTAGAGTSSLSPRLSRSAI